jgi:hypothetical protein
MSAFTTVFEQPKNYESWDDQMWSSWICTIA